MPTTLDDVAFPLFGSGLSASPVRDRLPMRLIELSGCTIDERWGGGDATAPTWRLYLNLDEGASALIRGRARPLRAGRLYCIPAWLRWTPRCRGRVRHFNAMLDLPAVPRERVMATCDDLLELAAAPDPLAAQWLDCAAAAGRGALADAELLARGHAAVWAALARCFELLGPRLKQLLPGEDDRELERLRRWTEERLDQPLSRASLARAAGCSEAELARRFAARLGQSPMRWLRDLRVARAAQLLRSSELPLETVASRSGLGDRGRLSRSFQRALGCSPGAFRRQARGRG